MSRAFMVKQAPFKPTDIGGCQLWLDANDITSSSMTFSLGSNLSVWKDKSTSSNNFNLISGIPTSVADGGKNAIYIPSGAVMRSVNQLTVTTSSAYFIVCKLITIGDSSVQNINDVLQFINIVVGSYIVYIRFYQGVLQGTATPGNPGNTNDIGNGNFYVNGTFNPNFDSSYYLNKYVIIALVSPNVGGTTYLSISDTSYPRPFLGNIGEIICYPGGITSSQRLQIEAYLAQKWGLQPNLPQGHPGTRGVIYPIQRLPNASALPYPSTFVPTTIGGCQLWLDGADATTTILSGANVTTWRDKSGNGYHMNQLTAAAVWTGSAQYPTIGTSINGLQTVNFTAQAGLKQSTQLNGVTNLFWLGRIAAPVGSGGGDCFFLLGNDINYDWHALPYGSTFLHNAVVSSGLKNASPTSLYTSDANAITDTAFSNVYLPSAPNVSLLSVAGITGSQIYQGICYDRANHIGWCGDLAEVIVFSNALTTPDRQQVEGYLAWKWGLQTNLPGSHPYKNAAPTVPNALGISRPAGLPIPPIACYPTPNTQLFTVTFTYLATGDHSQIFQVPAAISPAKLTVYMWGAGGGGTTGTSRPTNYGGAGAYVQGILTVTPGETLGIIVGQGGIAITTNGAAAATTYGGGGGVPSGGNSTQNSSGGGRSAIQRAAADIVTAGAGGGSGMTNTGANPTSPVAYTLAGGAAAWTGTASAGDYPSSSSYAGQGGTTSGGGLSGNKALGDAAAAANGSQYTGGSAGQYGGGGGGGYYGGGGGTDDGGWGHGGGGGSSYTNLLANPTGSNSTNGYSAPNTSSPYYQSNVGAGGTTGVGGNGLIVLTYYS